MPIRISAPAAASDFAIAQPYPLSSATPAINALLPASITHYVSLVKIDGFILCDQVSNKW